MIYLLFGKPMKENPRPPVPLNSLIILISVWDYGISCKAQQEQSNRVFCRPSDERHRARGFGLSSPTKKRHSPVPKPQSQLRFEFLSAFMDGWMDGFIYSASNDPIRSIIIPRTGPKHGYRRSSACLPTYYCTY